MLKTLVSHFSFVHSTFFNFPFLDVALFSFFTEESLREVCYLGNEIKLIGSSYITTLNSDLQARTFIYPKKKNLILSSYDGQTSSTWT